MHFLVEVCRSFILLTNSLIHELVANPLPFVFLIIPSARALALAVGPVTATSANEAGEEPANTVAEAASELGLPDVAVVAGNRETGPGSTFVKIEFESDEPLVTIIREGVVPSRDVVTWWKNRH